MGNLLFWKLPLNNLIAQKGRPCRIDARSYNCLFTHKRNQKGDALISIILVSIMEHNLGIGAKYLEESKDISGSVNEWRFII
jgi:hypothetical protein